jgi:hypothetical protein
LTLLHLANFNSTNIGNGALIFGTERVLKEDLGCGTSFSPVAWDDYTFGLKGFDAKFVDLINQSDALIVGASVMLNGRMYLKHAGMRFDLPYELWTRIAKPVIFYAVSYRVWAEQPYHNLAPFKRAMDFILNSPNMLFSVRNDGSKPWLEALLGYQSEKIAVIPDPTLYVPTTDGWHPELAADKINVVISLNEEDEVYRFGGPSRERAWKYLSTYVDEQRLLRTWRYVPGWQNKKKQFLRNLAVALDQLARERDINVILCPHYFDDYKIIGEFLSHCSLRFAYQLAVSSGVLRVPQAPYFYDLYKKADVVVSMRIHSMTPAIGLGTPCVVLTSQSRMSEFLQDTGLQDLSVDIYDEDLTSKVYGLLCHALDHGPRVRARLQAVHVAMRERTRAYNQRVASLLPALSVR